MLSVVKLFSMWGRPECAVLCVGYFSWMHRCIN
uniref:Uncharacterized protein n=1 Tax=Anguilla anguilla TaxID=7936 RepID=A0A0E9PPQ9_ANGAN